MTKVMLICLVLGLTGLLWSPHSVEAKPFFFKFFDVPQSVSSTTRIQPQTPIVSSFVLTDFLARKLEFIAGILRNQGSVSYSVGFNNVEQAQQTTTTTSRPISTTPVQTVFVPDSTESIVKAPLATTERTVIDVSQPVITTSAPAIAAPTTVGTTASTTVGTTAGTTPSTTANFAPTFAPTLVPTTAAPTSASNIASAFTPEFGPTFASSTASTTAPAISAVTPTAAPTQQPFTFVPSFAPLFTPTTAATSSSTPAPTFASSTFARLVPSIPPTPESSTDKIIILSLFDQTSGSTSAPGYPRVTPSPLLAAQINSIDETSGSTSAPGYPRVTPGPLLAARINLFDETSSSTSAPGYPSVTVGPLLPVQATQKATLTSGFSVAKGTSTKKTGYGYSDPNVLLFEASNEVFNEVKKPADLPDPDKLDLDIRA